MNTKPSGDILKHISMSMLMPVIVAAIGVLLVLMLFVIIGVNIATASVVVAMPVAIFILVSYSKMLPLLLISVLVPVSVPVVGILKMTLVEMVVPMLFFIYILQRAIHRSDYNRVSFHDIPKGFLLLSFIGFLWFIASGDILPQNIFGFEELGSFRAYYTFFVGVLAYFLLLSLVKEEKHIRYIIKILFWISLLSVIYLLSLVVLNLENTRIIPSINWSIDYIGESKTSIRCIAMSSAALTLFLISLAGKYPKNLVFRISTMLFASAAVVYSGGRGVFGGWILTILGYLIIKRHYFLLAGASALAVAAIAVPAFFPKTVENLPESFRRVFEFRMDPAEKSHGARSWETRLDMWKVSLEDIKKHPLVGVGFRGLPINLVIYGELSGEELFIEMGVTSGSTHNAYIAYAQIFGIPALVLFLLIYLNHFRRTWKMCRKHPDPNVHNISLFIFLMLGAYFLIQLGGGGPKDVTFLMYLGLSQSVWLLVVHNQKSESVEEAKPVAIQRPVFAAAIEG
jgi:O-antigen ligase